MKGATDAGASCEEGDLWEGDALADAEASSWEGTGRLLVGDAVSIKKGIWGRLGRVENTWTPCGAT